MDAQTIFIVRLESGENVAQYTSQSAPPQAGDIIDIRHRDHVKPFEVVETTLQRMIGNYHIGVLIVKTPASGAIMKAVAHGAPLHNMLAGALFGLILMLLPILKKLRTKKES